MCQETSGPWYIVVQSSVSRFSIIPTVRFVLIDESSLRPTPNNTILGNIIEFRSSAYVIYLSVVVAELAELELEPEAAN
jgi:hypothetical protein